MLIFLAILTILGLVFHDYVADWFVDNTNHARAEKPVIYLYPEEETDIHVRLTLDGDLTVSYPAYPDDGWNITATPDGLVVIADAAITDENELETLYRALS